MLSSTVNVIVRRSWLLDGVRSLSLTNARCSNQNSDGGDDKKKAKQKLNSLLETIIKDDSLVKDDLPRQKAAPRPKLREKRAKERTERNLGEQIVSAAKEVAKKIEGDQNKTEAELLGKVVARDEKLQKSVFKASGKSTLNFLLKELEVEKTKERISRSTLQSMKEREEQEGGFSRADMMRSGAPRSQQRWTGETIKGEAVDIFGGRPLGIFKPGGDYQNDLKLDTWDQCRVRELKLTFTHPPRNIWEQMIQWTDKGIFWKFPIDNEQGLENEQEVSFVDHIFLDVHLEDWCPKRGPIRNYMDLVCIGLSRNHWLTVQEKKDHIMWYKEYFLSKKQLIKELGAGEFVKSGETSASL